MGKYISYRVISVKLVGESCVRHKTTGEEIEHNYWGEIPTDRRIKETSCIFSSNCTAN